MLRQKIELLAPGGDIDSIKAAIIAGADAVYCGLDRFNARNRAANITFENLQGILRLAHQNDCKVFLTLNIIIVDAEIPALFSLLNKLVNTSIDGIIVQDLGVFYLLSTYFKSFNIHASTQLTTHNKGQIKFLSKLNAGRVNLSRELNINEIRDLTTFGHQHNILTEVFVHGSYCISFSGICYMSSVLGGKSGNRGRCSQACRERYNRTLAAKDFPLNLKDNSAFFDLKELYEAGVDSLKIEGRIKEFEYVYTVVKSWHAQLEFFYKNKQVLSDNSALFKVFNRNFSNAFLKGNIGKDMFIDDPMSYSTKHLSDLHKNNTKEKLLRDQVELYQGKEDTRNFVKSKINELGISKIPLAITISGKSGEALKVSVKTPEASFDLHSEVNLAKNGSEAITHKMILSRLKAINETEYYIDQLDLSAIQTELYLPFKELTAIKKKLLFILNASKEMIEAIEAPKPKRHDEKIKSSLSVIIDSIEDFKLSTTLKADFYFQLPNSIKHKYKILSKLFKDNPAITPCFPAILIGEDYEDALKFLKEIKPNLIVTDNTGIALEAYKNGIPWIAGPYLNTINSFSLLCLKENFNCKGAFISNEISRRQIKTITKPNDFQLFYSIYHPIILMTSRQCLFHQVTGCDKDQIDEYCIQSCTKSATIRNLKEVDFYIHKTTGNYNCIYNNHNFLNTAIIKDIPNTFSSFFIDLRAVKTETKTNFDKASIIKSFENIIHGDHDASKEIEQNIYPTTNTQYLKGI